MQAVDLLKMGGQGLPGGKLCSRFRGACHLSAPCQLAMAACIVCLRERVIVPSGGPSHIRNPPLNALALSPSRHNGGSFFRFLALPPPSTTSSGWSAATRSSTISSTCFRHAFL